MPDNLTILLVDDSRVSRMLCAALIRSLRPASVIVEAKDGAEALEVLGAHQVDIAILDMNMPGMNGLELAAVLRAQYPQIKLAMLTANVQDSVRDTANALKVSFFRKPVTETVVSAILTALTH
ncbi:response regulator transcription factor [Leeia oryzae]|uniref:response regulator transcription factor n=1 Tax=Leeia oryzae TaxID=356662 RepID=UPI00036579C8|nr:response regulator [Leeia oryzae]